MIIRKLLTAAVLATGIAALSGPAFAGPLPLMGSIDVSGGSTGISTTGGVTTISFTNPGAIWSVTGAFNELLSPSMAQDPVCTACVTLGTPFSSNLSLSKSSGFELFTGTNNGNTVGLDVTSANFVKGSDGAYQVSGTGWIDLKGYNTAMGSYSMTIPGSNDGASIDIYSSVPEPGTLALFGAGLLGFAVFASRRRRSMKPLA